MMIVIMKPDATQENIDSVVKQINELGNEVSLAPGEKQTIIGIVGDKKNIYDKQINAMAGVSKIVEVSAAYKRASREFHPEDTVIDINGVKLGGGNTQVIAGPCSVDTLDYCMETAIAVKKAGATMFRAGAYKPRTSPYTFQGMGLEGLKILDEVRKETGLPIVTELMSERDIDNVYKYADVIQIGARNMQNFPLLKEIGKLGKPVILKNGIASTVKEHLMSAEYIMSSGLNDVILCLRGTRTYETAMRNTIDLSLVPYMQEKTHLPIIVDPSHAAGIREYVSPLGYAGMSVGADGLIVEVHPNPCEALSDADQALLPRDFEFMMEKLSKLPQWNQQEWREFDSKK
jgi:3-deoxy-7-phosphoheptulonate synthase